MVRYSFLVGLFHPRLHAGLSRRLRLLADSRPERIRGHHWSFVTRDKTTRSRFGSTGGVPNGALRDADFWPDAAGHGQLSSSVNRQRLNVLIT